MALGAFLAIKEKSLRILEHIDLVSFISKGDEDNEGAQIDLLIDRQNNVITICEMKFYTDDVTISKETAEKLHRRLRIFRRVSGTKKQVFLPSAL